ncbi:MAG: cysC [Polyangiaceae bacterium]|nr:cysC [Polyangiaceae bacterium]
MTGLPSSGKSTLAHAVRARLLRQGTSHCILDGDTLRAIITPTLGYSDEERAQFYEALARLAATLARQGLVVLVPATAHLKEYRAMARELAPRFLEVWVTTALKECQRRDPKGLYAAAVASPGHLPGIDVRYEPPEHPDVSAKGGEDQFAVERILELMRQPVTSP